jgi:hypothetical protein
MEIGTDGSVGKRMNNKSLAAQATCQQPQDIA